MVPSLWQIAAGLGVGAFVAALFYGVVRRFGRHKGEGFETSRLDSQATAIIAVLIILIAGGATITALVMYAPHPDRSPEPEPRQPMTNSSADQVPDAIRTNLYADYVDELGIEPFDWDTLEIQWTAWVDGLRNSGDPEPEVAATAFFRRVVWVWTERVIIAHADTLNGIDLDRFKARSKIFTSSLESDAAATPGSGLSLTDPTWLMTTYWVSARTLRDNHGRVPSDFWHRHKQLAVHAAKQVLSDVKNSGL